MNLPNKLTIARLFAIPLIIIITLIEYFKVTTVFQGVNYIITLENLLILIVFLIAAFTDFLDGHIARKYNLITDFGKFLDPLADKLLVLAAMIYLVEQGSFIVFGISFGFVVTIIFAREFMVTGMRLLAVDNNVVIAASNLGKFKTVSQMLLVIILLIDGLPLALISELAKNIFVLAVILLAGILTVVSGIDYFIKNKGLITNKK